ncbi:MAG: hypothetical protein AAGE80_18195 [Pseudomonadota bacterium]
MAWLKLSSLDFFAAVCSEANSGGAGSTVSDITLINLNRVMWVEVSAARSRISLQLDPEKWLVLSFRSASDFTKATGQLEALA